MNKPMFSYLLLFLAVLLPTLVLAREVSPIVSTDWLEKNLSNSGVVVLDVRTAEQYIKGHIPGARSAAFDKWIKGTNNLMLELPPDDTLLALIASLGINVNSIVVIVSMGDTDFNRADATWVAWCIINAGMENVAVLDGGYVKWQKDQKTVSTAAENRKAVEFRGKVNRSASVSRDYVLSKIDKSVIVDNRIPDEYFGIKIDPFAPKPGHIKSAVNLPAPWIYDQDGIFRSAEDIEAMAAGVIGEDKSKEVILYCGVGGYASNWWFLLTQKLGYKNVKLYEGSMEEWVKDPKAPMTKYSWD